VLAYATLVLAFLVGLGFRVLRWRWWSAWLASCAVMPAFILFAEFVLPYQGGGASMWPIAMIFGGIYGAMAGGLGVIVGWRIHALRDGDT
jgi:hypothetical protein